MEWAQSSGAKGVANNSFVANVDRHPNGDAGDHTSDGLLMVGTVQRLEEAITAGYASSYARTTMCGLADDTKRGYVLELRRLAVRIRRQPGGSTRESLVNQILHLVHTTIIESSLKDLDSGLCVIEKLGWIPPTMCAPD